jgi:hypothetical protein
MELNGLANIRMVLDAAKDNNEVTEEIYKTLTEQAVLMERYMIALKHIPDIAWHEVRANPELFPTRREMLNLEGEPYAAFFARRNSL